MNQDYQTMEAKIVERIGGVRVGDLLRRRRAELGQDIGMVAKSLRIRQRYLEAIEDGRLADLPGPTYVLGFVRSYAEYLGFDGGKIISEFRQEVGTAGPPQPIKWKPEGPVRGGRGGFWLILLILAALGAGWYFLGGRLAPPEFIDRLPTYLKPRAQALPPEAEMAPSEDPASVNANGAGVPASEGSVGEADSSSDASSDSATDAAANSTVASEPNAASTTASVDSGSGNATGSVATAPSAASPTIEPATASAGAGATDSAQPSTQMAAQTETAQETAEAPANGPKVVLRARQESWVQILDAGQQVVVSKILRSGETLVVPDQTGLVLNTGNAGGLDVEIDGRAAPSLGAVGLVRRGISLDPAMLASGQTETPTPTPPSSEPAGEATGN